MKKCLLAISFIAALLSPLKSALANTELPIAAFASLPYITNVSLSPDGKQVAALINVNASTFTGSLIVVWDLTTKEKKPVLKAENGTFVINWFNWANNNTLLVSSRYPNKRYGVATKETLLWKVDINTLEAKSVLSNRYLDNKQIYPQFQDRIVDLLDHDPNAILLALALDSNTSGTGVIRLKLDKGIGKTIESNQKHVFEWITDRQSRVRIAHYFHDTNIKYLTKDIGQRGWRTLWEYEAFSESAKTPMGFDNDPNILFYKAYHNDKLAIFKTDISQPDFDPELIYANPNYDVSGNLIYSKVHNKVVGITHKSGVNTYWNEHYSILQDAIDQALPDTNNDIYGGSDDENKFIVLATNNKQAGTYYLWDRKASTLLSLASKYPDLDPDLMREKNVIEYKARDELEIEGFLTLPKNKITSPVPTIIFPHGGPISNDTEDFDYWTQFFANRGYAVLQMNFRGSWGYGFDFMKAGLQNWGLQMQQDVEDGTRWLINQGIADPQKICIVGASYGGYAALMEAANNSELYQCAVSFGGVTDIPSLVKSARNFVNSKITKEQIGSNYKALRSRSPVEKAQDIDVPVLLVHGSKDRVVLPSHSKKMYKKLRKANKNVTYIELEDGDHYLSNQPHRLRFFNEMDQFLKQHLN